MGESHFAQRISNLFSLEPLKLGPTFLVNVLGTRFHIPQLIFLLKKSRGDYSIFPELQKADPDLGHY